MPDHGRATWPLDKGTVAAAEINGSMYFGANSSAPTYTDADARAAARMRDSLIDQDPVNMEWRNVGGYPNNALCNAVSTILSGASRDNAGSLTRAKIKVHVDRQICESCNKVLPSLAIDLGNPIVTHAERDSGLRSPMWNGRWLHWISR